MVNGLKPNEMVLSRKFADGQWYGSKEMVYPGNYQMVNGLEPNEMVLSRKLADGQWYGSQ